MTLLIPLGVCGVCITCCRSFSAILILLAIVYFSYRQTIAAYPNGGGSYTVASENLGARRWAAGGGGADDRLHSDGGGGDFGGRDGADFGAVPSLHRHTADLCLVILAMLALVNMRGVKDTGAAFIAADVSVCGNAAGD